MTTESLEKILDAHPFFQGLLPDHRGLLAGCAANVVFQAGDFILREDQAADRFHVIRQGRVALEIASPAGPVTIETLEGGEVLGWSWLFPPYKSHFDARALTLVRALSLDGACLRRKCDADAQLGYDLMRRFAEIVVRRLESTRFQLLDLYGQPR
jgi:CRP-like cAMP-binding protein